jgi:hypothetical protein
MEKPQQGESTKVEEAVLGVLMLFVLLVSLLLLCVGSAEEGVRVRVIVDFLVSII